MPRSEPRHKKNAWYFLDTNGNQPPTVGQEWVNHNATCSWLIEHVKTLKICSHEYVNGREAYLCRVSVIREENKPDNVTELKLHRK